MRFEPAAVHGVVGTVTGLTSGGMAALVGSTLAGIDMSAPHRPRRAQLSNGTQLAVEQAFRYSAWLCGLPAKQPSGPRPDATQTPAWQVGWPPNLRQSSSVLHCTLLWSTIRLQPLP